MRVYVERDGKRIHLRSAYSADMLAKCKAIVGVSPLYDKATGKFKAWSYPLDYGTCLDLRRVFEGDLQIGPKLWEWAKAERTRYDHISALLAAPFCDLPRVRVQEPQIWQAMQQRPYQTVAAACAAYAGSWLIGDDPGLGKTVETFAAVVERGITTGPILVLCPSTAVEATWMREIWKWLPNDDVIPCVGTRKQREACFAELGEAVRDNARRTWFVCNIEMTRIVYSAECPKDPNCDGEKKWCEFAKSHKVVTNHLWPEMFGTQWNAIISDESHLALVTTKSQKKKQSQKRVGFGALQVAEGGLKLALSGTPWRGKAENFWGTLNWLRPDIYTGYWRWAEKYWNIMEGAFGGRKLVEFRAEYSDEWNAELNRVMIRRTKDVVAKDLPPKLYMGTELEPGGPKAIWLELTPAQRKAYTEMQRAAEVELLGGTLMGNGILAQMTRLQQFARSMGKMEGDNFVPTLPSNKWDWLLQFFAERGILDNRPGGKVIITSRSTPILKLFRWELTKKKVDSLILTGQTSKFERLRQVERFQEEGGPRVFFLNKDAGGTSITLDAADEMVMLDRSWIPDDDTQVEDRIHRVSRIHQCSIYYLFSLGTIEEEIARVADSRDDLQRLLLDGRHGVDFAKLLLKVAA